MSENHQDHQDPREREIRRQFLDEAQAYLTTLERMVLGLAGGRVDLQKVNEAMRAAHSIKGGAAMMGYGTLSEFAHRLEDSFKVLKTKRESLEISADLENMLLTGVDCLQRVIQVNRQGQPLDPHWLEQDAHPLFDQLYQCLGDAEEESAASVLGSGDGGQELLSIVFGSEVEAVLEQLENLLQKPDEEVNLRDEVITLAGELGGLGEMLQLSAFTVLCESVLENVDHATVDIQTVAVAALEAWRRAQALVLTQQLDLIPTELVLPTSLGRGAETTEASSVETSSVGTSSVVPFVREPEPIGPDLIGADLIELEGHFESAASQEMLSQEALADLSLSEAALDELEQPGVSQIELDPASEVNQLPASHMIQATDISPALPDAIASEAALQEAEVAWTDASNVAQDEEDEVRTVRVSLRRVEQLNDLFGELTIERNALALYCDRLRSLTQSLKQRVKVLDQSNRELRTAYDEMASVGKGRALVGAGHASINGNGRAGWPVFETALQEHSLSERGGFDRLELDRYNSLSLQSQETMETIVQIQEVTTDIDLSLEEADQTLRNLNKTAKHLRNQLTHLRMRPLSDVLDRFPRALRELGREHGKRVSLQLKGSDTLVDRNVLEAVQEPLMHLLRNAFDHGLETPDERSSLGKSEEGQITIHAKQRGNRTLIEFEDDGRGIDTAKIKAKAAAMGLDEELLASASQQELLSLIFEPGFSTKEQVTALSGRGVGMDVVRDRLKTVRGEITAETRPGQGTTFTLSMPFSLAVLRVLVVESQGMLLAIPADSVTEVILVDQVPQEGATEQSFIWNGETIQRLGLTAWLQFNCPRPPYSLETNPKIDSPALLLIKGEHSPVALQFERSWGEQEVAVRRIEGQLGLPKGFSHCTIMGDGRVIPLVNLPELLLWMEEASSPGEAAVRLSGEALQRVVYNNVPLATATKPAVLVVDDSINVRRFLALTLEKAGYRVEQAKDGQQALEMLAGELSIQAIICDIEMPRLDGYGVLAQVKADPAISHLPIAMLTSRSGDKHRKLAMDLGASAYFSKPYNEQTLLAELEVMMAVV